MTTLNREIPASHIALSGSDLGRPNRILVVDDEPSLLEICQEALADDGYDVFCANTGQEALDCLFTVGVDLVLSDFRMPKMSGLELLENIKAKGFDADFLLMTGFGTTERAVESIKKGAADYIAKPFSLSHLLTKVKTVLEERQQRADRKKTSNLIRMSSLSDALNVKESLPDLVTEFLFHAQMDFSPDGIFLQLPGFPSINETTVKGDLLHKGSPLLAWIEQACESVQRKGESRIVNRSNIALEPIATSIRPKDFVYSVMVVPLSRSFRTIGAIAVIRGEDKPGYTSGELQLLTVFSSHIASCLENLHLYTTMKNLNMEVISSYAQAVEAKDVYTRGHSERVAAYARILGQELGLSGKDLDTLHVAGLLHDIGKIGIPDQVLNKPHPLTSEEYEIMMSHPRVGGDILSRVTMFKEILPLVYHHHERIDGKGYPDGLQGDEIPFLARIISVVDSYEAMTSDRAYRKALSADKVRDILVSGIGKQWERDLVEKWIALLDKGLPPYVTSRHESVGIFGNDCLLAEARFKDV